MNIRPITEADADAIRPLWAEFEAEVPEPEGFQPDTWEEAWGEFRQELGFLAEDEEGVVAYAFAKRAVHGRAHLDELLELAAAGVEDIATAQEEAVAAARV